MAKTTRQKDAHSVLWQYKKGRKQSVSFQLTSDLYNNYLRNVHNKTTSTPEDAERVTNYLYATRFWAARLQIPLWKMIDIIYSRGMIGFYEDHKDALEKLLKQDKAQIDIAEEVMQYADETAEDYNAYNQRAYEHRIAESELEKYIT